MPWTPKPDVPPEVRAKKRAAAYTRWSKTVDRTAATAPGRAASPSNVAYWLARQPADLPEPIRERNARAARSAYMASLTARAIEANRARREAS